MLMKISMDIKNKIFLLFLNIIFHVLLIKLENDWNYVKTWDIYRNYGNNWNDQLTNLIRLVETLVR